MVVYIGHRLLTIRGFQQSSLERWGIGLRFSGDSTATPTQAEADEFVAPTRTWFTTTSMFFPIGTTIDEIKLAPIGTNGKYPPGLDSTSAAIGAAITGNTNTQAWPMQCSLAITLTTALPRGRGHIGRFYLPAMRNTIPFSAGQLGATEINGILAATKTWINAMNAFSDLGSLEVFGPFGTANVVTGIRCGTVVDTQRRRRRSLTEAPIAVSIP
jgi:hypothetical protein